MKRLIVCSDGTWQDLSNVYPTNVVKNAQAVMPIGSDGTQQIIYYDEGLGTKQIGDVGAFIDKTIKIGGGGIGLGIDHKILDAYLFLCLNYEPGDEVYLLGFSRGAYTVRSLAGLIYNSGLPSRKFIRMIPAAYELYRSRDESDKPRGDIAKRFRISFGDQIPIKALCCWDTVASMGLPEVIPGLDLSARFNKRYDFHDNKINETIEHAFHAVAIDEDRKVFNLTPMESKKTGQLSQIWFPGGHGSVGGGSEEERGLSDRALEWMLDNQTAIGLSLDKNCIEHSKDGEQIEYGLEHIYNTTFKQARSILGHKKREIPATATLLDLDISTKRRWKDGTCNYRPKNMPMGLAKALDEWQEDAKA